MNQSSTINILKSTSKHKPNEIEVKVENIYADDSPKHVRMMDPLIQDSMLSGDMNKNPYNTHDTAMNQLSEEINEVMEPIIYNQK